MRICSPSANGKNASEAATDPRARSGAPSPETFSAPPALLTSCPPVCAAPRVLARSTARRQESRRLTWPMPTPTVAPSWASSTALDLAARTARHAKARSARTASSAAGPAARVQVAGSSPSASTASAICSSMPPETCLASTASRRKPSGRLSRRRFFLAERISRASGSNAGATTTSVNTSFTWAAMAAVTGRLAAITPPNAETGSHAWALACACAMSVPSSVTARPHGLACLTIATAGTGWSKAARTAASAST